MLHQPQFNIIKEIVKKSKHLSSSQPFPEGAHWKKFISGVVVNVRGSEGSCWTQRRIPPPSAATLHGPGHEASYLVTLAKAQASILTHCIAVLFKYITRALWRLIECQKAIGLKVQMYINQVIASFNSECFGPSHYRVAVQRFIGSLIRFDDLKGRDIKCLI